MRSPRRIPRRPVAAAIAVVVAAGCSGSYTGPGGVTGGITSEVVGARLAAQPMLGLRQFFLYVHGVEAQSTADTTQVFNVWRTTQTVDLLALAGTAGAILGPTSIPTGSYRLRLVVDSARIMLAAGTTFANGDSVRTLIVPAGLRSIAAVHAVSVTAKVTYLLDIDPGRSIVYAGTRTHPTSATLAPLLYAIADTAAVSIAGTVTPAANHDTLYAVSSAGDSVATAFADTVSGNYVLRFVTAPDSITIRAHGNAFSATKKIATRPGIDTTGVNLP